MRVRIVLVENIESHTEPGALRLLDSHLAPADPQYPLLPRVVLVFEMPEETPPHGQGDEP